MSRFFHALVVFGAGVSLSGCGGKTTDEGQHGDPGAGGSSGSGSGGANAAAGSETILFGSAGVESTGSGGIPPVVAPHVDAGSIADAPTLAQWDCSGQAWNCQRPTETGFMLVGLDSACPVDKSRPRGPSDCGPGEWFECDAAILNGRQVAVTCRCTPGGDGGVGCGACNPAYTVQYQELVSCMNHSKLCGCAVTLIR